MDLQAGSLIQFPVKKKNLSTIVGHHDNGRTFLSWLTWKKANMLSGREKVNQKFTSSIAWARGLCGRDKGTVDSKSRRNPANLHLPVTKESHPGVLAALCYFPPSPASKGSEPWLACCKYRKLGIPHRSRTSHSLASTPPKGHFGWGGHLGSTAPGVNGISFTSHHTVLKLLFIVKLVTITRFMLKQNNA